MEKQRSGGGVLLLDRELLLADELGGEDSLPLAPDTLLLTDALPAAGPIRPIELRPHGADDDLPLPSYGFGSITRKGQRRASAAAKAGPPTVSGRGDLESLLERARQSAQSYFLHEVRTRKALHVALGKAYEFSLAALAAPAAFDRLLASAGLARQDRAPMTPILKLVFGSEYDKRRLTEYAAVLSYARRKAMSAEAFAAFLAAAQGGIKGIVAIERSIRHGCGSVVERIEPRPAIARRLRQMRCEPAEALAQGDDEFALFLARRLPDGGLEIVSAVPRDVALLERAARRLFAARDARQAGRMQSQHREAG
ncbi:hypothetical protein GRI75_06845 [Altererythrobacter soli]|uniref:Uncharacterized protein n=1 Tax=Croceibacterium soli TaxID=1739690 RepID=A0A6I4UV67_9SPHN|nr:hypothetical protein [Croceibacterium soli]MXP41357.1 hypothetical protein [Croceibacterium soli]